MIYIYNYYFLWLNYWDGYLFYSIENFIYVNEFFFLSYAWICDQNDNICCQMIKYYIKYNMWEMYMYITLLLIKTNLCHVDRQLGHWPCMHVNCTYIHSIFWAITDTAENINQQIWKHVFNINRKRSKQIYTYVGGGERIKDVIFGIEGKERNIIWFIYNSTFKDRSIMYSPSLNERLMALSENAFWTYSLQLPCLDLSLECFNGKKLNQSIHIIRNKRVINSSLWICCIQCLNLS